MYRINTDVLVIVENSETLSMLNICVRSMQIDSSIFYLHSVPLKQDTPILVRTFESIVFFCAWLPKHFLCNKVYFYFLKGFLLTILVPGTICLR